MSRAPGAVLAASALLAAAGPLAAQMHTPGGAEPARSVAMGDAGVTPGTIVLAPGARAVWLNVGRNRHTVTADDGTFDSGILAPGQRFALTAPETPMRLPYHCALHAFIRGTVVVAALALNGPEAVTIGRAAVLDGQGPAGEAGREVTVEVRDGGGWVPAATVAARPDGTFTATLTGLTRRTAVRARSGPDVSPALRIGVRPRVGVRRVGRALLVRVSPAAPGARLMLERLDLDTYRWHPVRTAVLRPGRTARLRPPRAGVWRVRVPAAAPGLAEAVSRAVPTRAA